MGGLCLLSNYISHHHRGTFSWRVGVLVRYQIIHLLPFPLFSFHHLSTNSLRDALFGKYKSNNRERYLRRKGMTTAEPAATTAAATRHAIAKCTLDQNTPRLTELVQHQALEEPDDNRRPLAVGTTSNKAVSREARGKEVYNNVAAATDHGISSHTTDGVTRLWCKSSHSGTRYYGDLSSAGSTSAQDQPGFSSMMYAFGPAVEPSPHPPAARRVSHGSANFFTRDQGFSGRDHSAHPPTGDRWGTYKDKNK
jgi:hypothetical protein